ncbi:hypothetical protein D9M71_138220 [compost metagenome]
MGVGRIATPFDHVAVLIECGFLVQLVVAVQLRKILSDDHPLGVLPGPLADAITRIDSRLTTRCCDTQVCVPGVFAGTGGGGQRLAMLVGTGQPTQVRAFSRALAGDEKGHAGRVGVAG